MAENDINVDVASVLRLTFADKYESVNVVLENDKEGGQEKVNIQTNEGDIDVVVKMGKGESAAEGFRREAYVLTKIVPHFLDIQKYLKIQKHVAVFPKLYNILSQDGTEIIVLEDLEKKGFQTVSDLNETNYKLVLGTVAKYHALSFALRHLHKDKFDEILSNSHVASRSASEDIWPFFNSRLEKIKFNLKLRMRFDLLKKFEDALEHSNGDRITKILNDTVENSVLIHGDYHQQNILFKYEGEEKQITDVALTGFQASGLHSPVMDISHYFFSSSGNEFFSGVSDFLKFYYQELSSFLQQLGCNVEELYPYSTLQDHWKKYSFYGFCVAVAYLELGTSNQPKDSSKKEYSEVAATLQNSVKIVSNVTTYRHKLEKIVQGFLDELV